MVINRSWIVTRSMDEGRGRERESGRLVSDVPEVPFTSSSSPCAGGASFLTREASSSPNAERRQLHLWFGKIYRAYCYFFACGLWNVLTEYL